MPYFKWTGVDSIGNMKKGYLLAYSPQELDNRLLKRGIALISCKKRFMIIKNRAISAQQKSALFSHVAQLLRSGIMLPQALELAALQSTNFFLYDIVSQISKDVSDGSSFINAFACHEKISDPFVMTILAAGHEGSGLAQAFEHCALYYKKQSEFEKAMYASLATPVVTILFFIAATFFIFTLIIPRFADMFASLQHDLPVITRYMICVSSYICSGWMYLAAICCGACIFCFYYWFKRERKVLHDALIVRIPFFGQLLYFYHLQQILRALSLLTHGGITLSKSLILVVKIESNHYIQKRLKYIEHAVSLGVLISDAMMESDMFFPDVIAIIHVGQESGFIAQSFEYTADIYRNKIDETLRTITLLIQPTIIIALGFLITLLIFSVYLPIIELSRII